ncbi:zinc finger protein [Haematococcus lacustris]|uniref:Zinc finger protein n=1 Tax=Haematococcus lacustris TaxID=44745 RepID=A0A699ZSN3_HAELA|nr:zinc finger protein [Haematococcus lacustris]
MGGGPSRKVGSNKKHQQNPNKRLTRRKFQARHIDQVWEDVRKPVADVHQPGKTGPQGTTAHALLDEDVPGHGRHYCVPCARVKMLMTSARPHRQADADTAGNMGAPDNGPRLRSTAAAAMEVA